MKILSTRVWTLALAATAVALLVGLAGPASASPAPPPARGGTAQTAAQAATAAPVGVVSHRCPGCGTWTDSCFGSPGNFNADSQMLIVDWNGDRKNDECFGVGPNRVIYHAWKNHVGWEPMPNNGRADDMVAATLLVGHHNVEVFAALGASPFYCSSLIGTWQPWVAC